MGNKSCGYNLENRRIRLKMKGLQREGLWQNKRKKYCICNFANGNYRFITMISALVGVAIIALPSGIITAAYMDEINKHKSKLEL